MYDAGSLAALGMTVKVVPSERSDEGILHRGGSLAESRGFEAALRRIPRR